MSIPDLFFKSGQQEVKKAAKQLAVTQLPLKNVFLWSKYMHS